MMSGRHTLHAVCVTSGAPRRPLPPSLPSPDVAAFNEGFPRGPRRISRQNAIFWHMGTRRKSPENASEMGEILMESTTHPRQDPAMAGAARQANPPLFLPPTKSTSPSLREASKAMSGVSDAFSGRRQRGGRE